jgi:hypothetical protein
VEGAVVREAVVAEPPDELPEDATEPLSRAGILSLVPIFIAVGSTVGFALAMARHAFSLPR